LPPEEKKRAGRTPYRFFGWHISSQNAAIISLALAVYTDGYTGAGDFQDGERSPLEAIDPLLSQQEMNFWTIGK
jgi:hypothetical protein